MAKEVMFWTLVTTWGGGLGFEIVGVTSYKGNQVYGTTKYGNSTHRRRDDCKGKFPTLESAEEVIDQIIKIRKEYELKRIPVQKILQGFSDAERQEISRILQKVTPTCADAV